MGRRVQKNTVQAARTKSGRGVQPFVWQKRSRAVQASLPAGEGGRAPRGRLPLAARAG